MEEFRESVLITVATPIYLVVIGLEIIFSHLHQRKYYSSKGVLTNVYLMGLNMGLDILLRGVCLMVLNYFFEYRLMAFGNPVMYWLVLLIAQDFLYYLLHVADHYCRLFWAVHVTHHSSEEFNLTVGFRSSVFQPVYRFIYFIPLALMGFKGIDIMFLYSATQIWGILVHTQTVGKLGWLEYILVTPSHHRVHHGSNPKYLDKNMGMLLIIWDRMFGTFQEELEKEPVRYGLTTNLKSQHPAHVVFHEWKSIADDLRKPVTFADKLRYLFFRPGWSHDGSRMTSEQLRETEQAEHYEQEGSSNFSSLRTVPSKTA
jgi:sterol desaturase/sphingolipid hydroxylase (fatty acid hydroxylase superfamily)